MSWNLGSDDSSQPMKISWELGSSDSSQNKKVKKLGGGASDFK